MPLTLEDRFGILLAMVKKGTYDQKSDTESRIWFQIKRHRDHITTYHPNINL
jgi:hypothetical protein